MPLRIGDGGYSSAGGCILFLCVVTIDVIYGEQRAAVAKCGDGWASVVSAPGLPSLSK